MDQVTSNIHRLARLEVAICEAAGFMSKALDPECSNYRQPLEQARKVLREAIIEPEK